MAKKKFSKDPKVRLIPIEVFFEESGYLSQMTEEDIWNDKTAPEGVLYKFTPNLLISIWYGICFVNYGTAIKEKLEMITVSYRDGETEYKILDEQLNKYREERAKYKRNKKLDEKINNLLKNRELLPPYKELGKPTNIKSFDSYLKNTGYKTTNDNLKDKYLVFDVETNGTRKTNDDLLSLSIYDPTTGICYNRFFPLDLQPLVLTTFINGITDEMLADAIHMTQEEMDWLINYFRLKDRILLSFSGGQGTFDSSFVQNYCKRHGIIGFDNLRFENIKNRIPHAPFGTEGQLTKDNLCRMFGIEGVSEIHSSYNDCILEWKLFEKLESECVFFINEHLFKYTPEYIIPVSYLIRYPDLAEYAGIKVPHVKGKTTGLFQLRFPQKLLGEIKKFPTNITGITIEHGINTYLKAEEQDNYDFLVGNKSHLKYVGSLDSTIKDIPIIAEDDGTVKAVRLEDIEYVNNVNDVTRKIISHIKPVADYLRENIFHDDKIMTQEISISEDKKILALCDLSDSKNVVEIKTCNVLDVNNDIVEGIARQLYYQAKGRNTFILSIKFDTHRNNEGSEMIVDDVNIYLYKVDLYEYSPNLIVRTRVLLEPEIRILKEIENDPYISNVALANILGYSTKSIVNTLAILKRFGYLKRDNPDSRKAPWLLLRETTDYITKYTFDGVNIHIVLSQNQS